MTERPRAALSGPRADLTADQITFIGTATTPVQVAGFTILTDPNFLHRGSQLPAPGILLTMDARQGVEALRTVTPREAIPVHYDDYTLFKSPLSDLRKAVGQAGLPSVIHYLNRGDSYRLTVG